MYQILAADIGGTTSRMGFFEFDSSMDEPRLLDIVHLPTAESDSFPALLARLFSEQRHFSAASSDLAVLAVPGPVEGRFCRPPNIKWTIDLHDISTVGLRRGALLNDFAAQAFACRSHAMREARVLQPSRADHAVLGGTIAVIGAGTGLGHCALVCDGADGHLAVASEGGHAAFPFVGEEECAYGEYVRRVTKLPYCHGDAIVSGSGLSRLHAFLTGEELSPATVAARLANAPRTVEWFARFYGRAARNYALMVLAQGGVYVTGGVAARNPVLVEHPVFLTEFRSAPAHGALLSGLPVSFNRNEDAGVYGAAFFGAQRLRRHG
ncbi:MAG: glucokinase [Humidesulfovibrio sp.]|nr:glucokinase [Humidesulfovibrio sp.]